MKLFGHYAFEPVWKKKSTLRHTGSPLQINSWLFDPSSLTARLKQLCDGQFRVEVVSQGWDRPMFNEARRLGVKADQHALIRQVYLFCDDRPWVFARTVIPHSTLRGKQRSLAYLGNRSLGSALFSDPTMHRDEVEVACIHPYHRIYATAAKKMHERNEQIWGRRSVFYTGEKPLLVTEVFLPALFS